MSLPIHLGGILHKLFTQHMTNHIRINSRRWWHKNLPMQCYHLFHNSVVYLAKNHHETCSPQMVPTAPLAQGQILTFVLLHTWTCECFHPLIMTWKCTGTYTLSIWHPWIHAHSLSLSLALPYGPKCETFNSFCAGLPSLSHSGWDQK